jgi:OmpA-OmpF porin, OOP family
MQIQKIKYTYSSGAARIKKGFATRILLILAACVMINIAQAQDGKNLVLADAYYASGEYLTAAGLYQQFLHPPVKKIPPSDFPLNSKRTGGAFAGHYKNKTDIIYKQAESYRLANYWIQARALYQQCLQTDPEKYQEALYWIAVCERNLGNYSAAEDSLTKFLAIASKENKQEAEKERTNLLFIKNQLNRPDTVLFHISKLSGIGSAYAITSAGDKYLLTGIQTDSVTVPGMNPNHNRIFSSSLSNGNVTELSMVNIDGMNTTINQGTASMSPDGNYLYFTQWSKVNGINVSSIYYAVKKGNVWTRATLLNSVNQSGHNSQQPFCTSDGKYLFFASDRKGSLGKLDIWYAPLQSNGKTGPAVNAGDIVNTPGNEQAPFYQASSSTLVFSSDRIPGMGGYDLYQTTGSETSWEAAKNMGYPVNSSRDDIYFFSNGKDDILENAWISSDRGSECCLGLYNITKTAKKKIFVGAVRDCASNEPVADAEVIMVDADGNTMHATTNAEGKYSFNLNSKARQVQTSIVKESYTEKTIPVKIESTVSAWLDETINNADVCVEKQQQVYAENVVSIYFDFDRSKLTDGGKLQLDSIYNVMISDTTVSLQIFGYADGRGSEIYNKALSDKRAKACAEFLMEKGIPASRMTFEAFGSCCPVEMEKINGRDNQDARAMNRRALINVTRR